MKRVTPTFAEIDLEALRFNYRQLKKCYPATVKTLCVVKSNAYGHGSGRVAKVLQEEGADYFGVGTIDEGVELRESGVKKPILLLMGLIQDHPNCLLRYQLTPVLYNLEEAKKLHAFLSHSKRRLEVHVKVDTGMMRLGVLPKDVAHFCDRLKTLSLLNPVGFMTHLADAGDKAFTTHQEKTFEVARKIFQQCFPGPRTYHISNSQAAMDGRIGHCLSDMKCVCHREPSHASLAAGSGRGDLTIEPGRWPRCARHDKIGDDSMVRLGVALYGAYPFPEKNKKDQEKLELKPVMHLKSRVISIKRVPAKTAVSYGRTFITKKESVIGVVPVGYADGYPRSLSNKSEVLVKGKRVPVVGTVCMDMMMIDLTSLSSMKEGEEVVLFGKQGKEEIRAEELAALAETISYEIFCRISSRVPRVYR